MFAWDGGVSWDVGLSMLKLVQSQVSQENWSSYTQNDVTYAWC